MIKIKSITGLRSFDLALKKAEKAGEKVIRSALIELGTSIVSSTPEDTGRLRGNWQAAHVYQTGETGKQGVSAAIQQIKSFFGGYKLGQGATLFNNAPYADLIERGRSNQAPAGMVQINLNRFDSIVDKAIVRHGDK